MPTIINEVCAKATVNRFKSMRGFARKELIRPKRKYADFEQWKRAKNVAIQRQSRTKNQFDIEDAVIPQHKEVWPYEGPSDYMAALRKKHILGGGW